MSTLPVALPVRPLVGPLLAAWLLTRLRLRRQFNFFGSTFQRKAKGAGDTAAKRSGSAPKAGTGLLIGLGLTMLMVLFVGVQARQAAVNFACMLLTGCTVGARGMAAVGMEMLTSRTDIAPVMLGFSLILALLVAMCTLIPLGNTELTQDWDLEWLATLPIGRSVLLGARVLERSVVNSTAVVTIWPMLTVLAWFGGWRFWSPLVALLPTCMMLLLIGAGRALGDTGLRMLLAPAKLRSVQALLSIAGTPFVLLVIVYGMPKPMPWALDLVRSVPQWFLSTPFGLAVQSVYLHPPGEAMGAFALGGAMVLALAAATVLILALLLRKGINAGGAREAGRAVPSSAPISACDRWRFGSAVSWREMLLLGRDRNYLVQTLILPALLIVSQLAINGTGHNLAGLAANAPFVATMAFSLSAYVLMQSAFQTLNTEGGALWILYTVPRPLLSILREKIILWSVVACLYALPVFGLAIWLTGEVSLELAGMAGMVLLGLPIYAAIAGALGIFGCNPLSEDRRHRVRPTFIWLYLILTGFYSYALFTPDLWRKLVLLIFSGALAVSLWQKAQDRLPYLLDPAASPPSRVSTADGMIGAMMFLVLQGLIAALAMNITKAPLDWSMLAMSFGAAGAITVASMLLVFGRTTEGVPAFLPARPLYSVGVGAALGLCALGLALLYLWVVKPVAPPTLPGNFLWFALLAVVLAPLAEEFIFRGLLYAGLRRSYPDWVSVVASSALFGAVHPAASFVPVFGLGVLCALAYRKTGALLAPIVAHALYNGLLVVLSRFLN